MNKSNVLKLNKKDENSLINHGVWSRKCPVGLNRLSKVNIQYSGFDEVIKNGEMIVFDVVAPYVIQVFQELLEKGLQIDKVVPMQHYNGSDEKSMEDNNTSAYNGRMVSNTDKWSSHAYGMAIDINPIQNPFLKIDRSTGQVQVIPKSGIKYINRHSSFAGKVEDVVNVLAKHGFSDWGGSWNDPIDYHHFQIEWEHIMKLNEMNYDDGMSYYREIIITL